MRLRIRHANGMATLSDITADQTVSKLKKDIVEAIGLSPGQNIESKKKKKLALCVCKFSNQRISIVSGGYPPKPINSSAISLESAGLRDGDTLNIKILENVITAPQQQQEPSVASANNKVTDRSVETPAGFLTLRVIK
jgi:ubiquitin thioesterase OTU1